MQAASSLRGHLRKAQVFRVSKLSKSKDPLTFHEWAGQQSPVPQMAPNAWQVIE